METVTKMLVGARETIIRKRRGQTITEYSLIFASIAVVAYGVYATMGNDIVPLASGIGSTLADACGRVLRHR
jgi:Flp pilus assembly pilin Flp